MSRHGLITLDFGDGTHAFRLGLDGLEEIEAKCDASVFEIGAALQARSARVKWISEVLRVGLIGGGMAPVEALALVRRYVDARPLEESRDTAYAVCLAGVARLPFEEAAHAAEDNTAGEPDAPKTTPPRRRKRSTSGPSAAPPS